MPEDISQEARDEYTRRRNVLLVGWILAHWRHWAWLHCNRCGWWMVSGSEDLVPYWVDHEKDQHPRRWRHTR